MCSQTCRKLTLKLKAVLPQCICHARQTQQDWLIETYKGLSVFHFKFHASNHLQGTPSGPIRRTGRRSSSAASPAWPATWCCACPTTPSCCRCCTWRASSPALVRSPFLTDQPNLNTCIPANTCTSCTLPPCSSAACVQQHQHPHLLLRTRICILMRCVLKTLEINSCLVWSFQAPRGRSRGGTLQTSWQSGIAQRPAPLSSAPPPWVWPWVRR